MKKTLFLAAVLLCAPAFAGWGGGYSTNSGGTHPTQGGNFVLYYGNNDPATATEGNISGHTESVDDVKTFYIAADKDGELKSAEWYGSLTVNMSGANNYAIDVIQRPWTVGGTGFTNLNITSMAVGQNFHLNVFANNTVTLNAVSGELNSVVKGHDGTIEGTATLKTTADTTFASLTLGDGGNLNVTSGTTVVNSLSRLSGSALSVESGATLLVKAVPGGEWASLAGITGRGRYGYSITGYIGDDGLSFAGAAGNVIKLNGITGILGSSSGEIAKDVILENSDIAAAEFMTIKGDSYTFNGAISGNGNFVLNQAGKKVTITLNGDISEWNTVDDKWSGLRGGDGCEVTANLNDAGVVQAAFNVHTLNIGADTQMMKRVNVTNLTVAKNHTVSTHNYFGAQSISLADGASLTLDTSEASRTVGSLTLGDGASITLSHNDSHEGKALYTTGALTVEGHATMNADLVMSGGTMTFENGAFLTMGCAVTIGMGDTVTVELTQEMVDTIAGGGRVDLFTSVETATLGSHIVFTGTNGAALDKADTYSLQYDAATKTIYATPEPATATLSLLALAGLCARRKRH